MKFGTLVAFLKGWPEDLSGVYASEEVAEVKYKTDPKLIEAGKAKLAAAMVTASSLGTLRFDQPIDFQRSRPRGVALQSRRQP